jgi:serine/threonine protein kinase
MASHAQGCMSRSACSGEGSQEVPASEVELPATIGGFRVVRRIGEGGSGTVYEAVDDSLARTVAIKRLPAGEPELYARLLNEARAVNLIRHRGIVAVSEVKRCEDGSSYLVMDYLEGETLRSLLQKRPPLPLLLRLAHQIACALAATATLSRKMIDRLKWQGSSGLTRAAEGRGSKGELAGGALRRSWVG